MHNAGPAEIGNKIHSYLPTKGSMKGVTSGSTTAASSCTGRRLAAAARRGGGRVGIEGCSWRRLQGEGVGGAEGDTFAKTYT